MFAITISLLYQVSRDGVHKLVCIWEYDKRSVNNANFVYYGMRIMRPDLPKCKEMVAYADKVCSTPFFLLLYPLTDPIHLLPRYLTPWAFNKVLPTWK